MADSLDTIRQRVRDLATESGDFRVACAETNDCPAPLTGKRFPSEQAASDAAALARTYRETLRESDPELPERQLSVYERSSDAPTLVSTRERAAGQRENGLPRTSRSVTLSGEDEREWLRMENAPLVHVRQGGDPLPDDAVERQLDAKL